jgi:hypothetical protein
MKRVNWVGVGYEWKEDSLVWCEKEDRSVGK